MAPWIRRVAGWLLRAVGLALALSGAALMVLHHHPELQLRSAAAAKAASFIPYGVVAWVLVAVILVTSHRRWVKALAVLAVGGAVLQFVWSSGPYWPRPAPTLTGSLTVMTLSTYYGMADPAQLVAEAERAQPDVVVLTEIDVDLWRALQASSWARDLPFHVGEPGPDWTSNATMVFSRYPVSLLEALGSTPQQHVVTVDLPAGPLTVIAVHARNPSDGYDQWASSLLAVQRAAEARAGRPVVALGDFNAVREHVPLQQLLDSGLADAAEQAGTGWLPTFPTRPYAWWPGFPSGLAMPPLIGLDHVLINDHLLAASVESFGVTDTDHRGLVARLDLVR